MPEIAERRARTIAIGVFLVVVGDLLMAVMLVVGGAVFARLVGPTWLGEALFFAVFNTAVLGWIWVAPVVLWLRRKRPLLARVMIFTSAILTLLDAACCGLIFYGSRIAG